MLSIQGGFSDSTAPCYYCELGVGLSHPVDFMQGGDLFCSVKKLISLPFVCFTEMTVSETCVLVRQK